MKNAKLFVSYLWFTFFVEMVGSYAPIAYFSDYKIFSFVEHTPFNQNHWLYNIFTVINFVFISYFFTSLLKNKRIKNIFYGGIIAFIILAVCVHISIGMHNPASRTIAVSGTLLILLSILSFYYELLRSDLLLRLKYFLPFYISIGILISQVSVAPIEFFADYFNLSGGNELFVALRFKVIVFTNVFLYLSFIIGFVVCSRETKSYY